MTKARFQDAYRFHRFHLLGQVAQAVFFFASWVLLTNVLLPINLCGLKQLHVVFERSLADNARLYRASHHQQNRSASHL